MSERPFTAEKERLASPFEWASLGSSLLFSERKINLERGLLKLQFSITVELERGGPGQSLTCTLLLEVNNQVRRGTPARHGVRGHTANVAPVVSGVGPGGL